VAHTHFFQPFDMCVRNAGESCKKLSEKAEEKLVKANESRTSGWQTSSSEKKGPSTRVSTLLALTPYFI